MNKHNTIGKGENERAINGGNDKFYTKNFIADYYSNIVLDKFGHDIQYIEPTAGAGAFLKVLPNIKAFDLIPECDGIIECDVFDNTFNREDVIVGNPPFGMSANLAIKIFNHIAKFKVKAICFIVPKTFKKQSVHDKLNLNYHITFEQDVINDAFTVEGKNKNVPCVFQIWELKKKKRNKSATINCKHLTFTDKENANVAVRRVGGKAGQVLEGINHNSNSTYFINTKSKKAVIALKLMNLKNINDTAGVRSVSKNEICNEVNRIMEVLSC